MKAERETTDGWVSGNGPKNLKNPKKFITKGLMSSYYYFDRKSSNKMFISSRVEGSQGLKTGPQASRPLKDKTMTNELIHGSECTHI